LHLDRLASFLAPPPGHLHAGRLRLHRRAGNLPDTHPTPRSDAHRITLRPLSAKGACYTSLGWNPRPAAITNTRAESPIDTHAAPPRWAASIPASHAILPPCYPSPI